MPQENERDESAAVSTDAKSALKTVSSAGADFIVTVGVWACAILAVFNSEAARVLFSQIISILKDTTKLKRVKCYAETILGLAWPKLLRGFRILGTLTLAGISLILLLLLVSGAAAWFGATPWPAFCITTAWIFFLLGCIWAAASAVVYWLLMPLRFLDEEQEEENERQGKKWQLALTRPFMAVAMLIVMIAVLIMVLPGPFKSFALITVFAGMGLLWLLERRLTNKQDVTMAGYVFGVVVIMAAWAVIMFAFPAAHELVDAKADLLATHLELEAAETKDRRWPEYEVVIPGTLLADLKPETLKAQRLQAEADKKKAAEEEQRLQAEAEEKKAAEEEQRLQAEAEEKKAAEEERRLQTKAFLKKKAAEDTWRWRCAFRLFQLAEAAAQNKAAEEARFKQAEAARNKAAEEARLKRAEAAQNKAAEEARFKQAEAARNKAAEERRRVEKGEILQVDLEKKEICEALGGTCYWARKFNGVTMVAEGWYLLRAMKKVIPLEPPVSPANKLAASISSESPTTPPTASPPKPPAPDLLAKLSFEGEVGKEWVNTGLIVYPEDRVVWGPFDQGVFTADGKSLALLYCFGVSKGREYLPCADKAGIPPVHGEAGQYFALTSVWSNKGNYPMLIRYTGKEGAVHIKLQLDRNAFPLNGRRTS